MKIMRDERAELGSPTPTLGRRIFRFNQTERDVWVGMQARKVAPGARVLDVGAGSCPYRRVFAHCQYETHDFRQLDASALFEGIGYGAIDYVSDITAIPVGNGTYDAVLCTEVLEHVPDPAMAVMEFARILKPGGRLILTAPLASGLHQTPYHFYGGFTPFWYRKYLGDAGFEDIEIEANGGFFKFYGQESQRFNLMLHPSRYRGAGKLVAALAWAATLPVCRVMIPIVSHWLDRTDQEQAFTIGYHVSAIRKS